MNETNDGVSIKGNITNNGQIAGGKNSKNHYEVHETINEDQSKSLAETAAEIQELLKQLEQSNPTKTTAGQMTVATQAIEIIESNPTLKQRVVGTLKSAGTEALKEALDHPVANILVAGFEGWMKP
ncbi:MULTISPECIES: hypothetical protein [Okeania]|uniref:Uncharacterized protein n=1 Tax=Okeania hirsuta TaxID=1458930 RepID=A0A3N6QDS7_9CYAN|nr:MULTISPECIES: hypothetical protein [Okeania]NET76909.1 hypothetical protein [Okeania sp. SIO1F9]RQH10856.1 hypothetical protein D4Z78_27585 [Okeania hirsuta]RQH34469.1 hypothetical protein D5R40_20825 [Okeania hirsuta]